MTAFEKAYTALNDAQRRAVDTIDGAVMVIAGPGTGKTQLLGTRAAHIVASGSANPNNILCLTYTEAGASEMRERLTRIMGLAGGEVAVHTFHSFGTLLISQYPEFFSAQRALNALDDLNRYRIFEQLLAKLPLRHQLAVRGENDQFIRRHAVQEAISAFKQAGLSPSELRQSCADNQRSFTELQPLLDTVFSSTLSAKRLAEIRQTAESITAVEPLSILLMEQFLQAVEDSETLGKTKPLGAWRDSYTTIKDGSRTLKSAATQSLLLDTVSLYEQYQAALQANGQYDYEDMILWAIHALQQNQDLLLDIAERYQYVMVDEYQDTNGAQNKLLDTLLQANPVDSPNVLVVGDDDQAIMRFQGAELSGMVAFVKAYQPLVIVLEQNYRSSQPIINAARQIITQSTERLEVVLPELQLNKQLVAANAPLQTEITYTNYESPNAQYAAVASQIVALLNTGVSATEIAVIGRKHAELAAFVPYLEARGIRTSYDRHEDILSYRQITELLQLTEFIVALQRNQSRAVTLLPGLLSAAYWKLPPLATYEIAQQARLNKASWLDTMLSSNNESWQHIAEWLIAAADQCRVSNFTQCLDVLIGRQPVANTVLQVSPFLNYIQLGSREYVTLLSHLIRLRTAVLEANPEASGLQDLLAVTKEYRLSGLRLVDHNPVLRGDTEGVQVLSAHSSKGLEFTHVIILSVVDPVWGSKARGQSQRIRLPENLPLYPAGDTDDDRLRLLYVAMTRAKAGLHIAAYTATDEGKSIGPLSYAQFEGEGWWQPVHKQANPDDQQQTVETVWNPAPVIDTRSLSETLQPLLKNYRLSASALRTFLDFRYGGPQACIEQSVLKFPSAYNAYSALGSATHKTLEYAYNNRTKDGLNADTIRTVFDAALQASGLTEAELEPVRTHGDQFLPDFVASFAATDFARITETEQFYRAELTNGVPVSGAVDALAKTSAGLEVIDYKTGKPPTNGWDTKGLTDSKKLSLHFYRQQLMFYKLLLDSSESETVTCAELVFAEPTEASTGSEPVRLIIDSFDSEELQRTALLAQKVYSHILAGSLPDTSNYSTDLKGVLAFEAALLSDEI